MNSREGKQAPVKQTLNNLMETVHRYHNSKALKQIEK